MATKTKAKKSTKSSKGTKKKKVAPKTLEAPKQTSAEFNPFRSTSAYGKTWAILSKAGSNGMTRDALVKEAVKITGKEEKHVRYDVAVVLSPSKDGKAHRSANRAADHYWVERMDGGRVILHLRKS